MSYNLIITATAEMEIIEACLYYEAVQNGLSDRFLNELYKTYKKLETNPQFYSYISLTIAKQMRDIAFNTFPYVVVFEIKKQEVIVHAVINTKRDR